MEILGQNLKSQQLLHHSCSGLSKKNTGGNWVEWDFRGIWYSSFPSSSLPHKHKSGDIPPSWCSVCMYRNVLCHISYLYNKHTCIHTHTEDSFTVSGKGILLPLHHDLLLSYKIKATKFILQGPGTSTQGSAGLAIHNLLPAQTHYLQTCPEPTKVRSGATETHTHGFKPCFGSASNGLAKGLQTWPLWISTDYAPQQRKHPLMSFGSYGLQHVMSERLPCSSHSTTRGALPLQALTPPAQPKHSVPTTKQKEQKPSVTVLWSSTTECHTGPWTQNTSVIWSCITYSPEKAILTWLRLVLLFVQPCWGKKIPHQ